MSRYQQVSTVPIRRNQNDESRLVLWFRVLGAGCVGKSTLIRRVVHNDYQPWTPPTIGVEFEIAKFNDVGRRRDDVDLLLWDTMGNERFNQSLFWYRGQHALLLCYDVSNKSSYDDTVEHYFHEALNRCAENTIFAIVGLKKDTKDDGAAHHRHDVVDQNDVCEWIQSQRDETGRIIHGFCVSSKTNDGVAEMITELIAITLAHNEHALPAGRRSKGAVRLPPSQFPENNRKGWFPQCGNV